MIEVEVFGSEPPCINCKRTEEEAKKAAAKFPGKVTVKKYSARSPEGLRLDLAMTPAVVVNGKMMSQGRIPLEAEFERIFRFELGG